MPSTVENCDLGRRRSHAVRSFKADKLLWSIRQEIMRLAREGQLRKTLREIAEQLNDAGLRTNHNNRFDAQKVHRAFGLMGVDRVAIRRWQRYAGEKAAEFEVPLQRLLNQLWQEWLHHELVGWIEHGASLINRDKRQFLPALVHPDKWVPAWEREPTSPTRIVPASPPAARVVYAMLGAFHPQD